LGNNSPAPESWIPVREDTNANDWVAIAAGGHHTLALKSNGDLYAWGNNYNGELGNGSTTGSNVPVLVLSELSDWVAIAAGAYHSVALKSDGTLWCWGENGYGQLGLGIGNFTDRSFPTRENTNGNDWASIAAGDNHTIAIKSNGTLWAWGMGNYGQLGNDSLLHSPTPVQEYTLSSQWVAANAGLLHSIAMQADGSLWTWGDNTYGQLGDGTTEDKIIPNQISVSGEEDLDVDGLPDSWELQIINYDTGDGINTVYDVNPGDDFDNDLLNNGDEYSNNTDPTDFDSDDDWVKDGREFMNGTDPNNIGEFTPAGTGAIRGTVMDAGLLPITTNQIGVQAITGDPCGVWQQIADEIANPDGTYSIVGLPPGNYWVKTENMWQSNYVNEWYYLPASSISCEGTLEVTVDTGDFTNSIDFQLEMGAEVSGTVYKDDGITEIDDAAINVTAYRAGDPCSRHTWSVGTQTSGTDGSFTLKGVPLGTSSVYLSTSNMNQSNYVNEWWRNITDGSVSDCNLAELLDVSADGVSDLSFQLDFGGSVSGYVFDESDNPIENLWVHVNDSLCGNGQWFGGG
jgi:hypothetical protein